MHEKDCQNPDNLDDANGVVGAAAGVGAGGVLGAMMGAGLAGPVGMLIGGSVGTVIGAAMGYAIDYDSHEPAFREHHESTNPQGGPTFEQASPAYRHGWEGHDRPELHDQNYTNARPSLRQSWAGSRDFAASEDFIKHGWERRAASKATASFSPAAQKQDQEDRRRDSPHVVDVIVPLRPTRRN